MALKAHILIAHARPDIVSGAELAISDFTAKQDGSFKITMLPPGEGKLAEFYRSRGFSTWARRVETRRRLYPGLHSFQSFFFSKAMKARELDLVLCNTFSAASRVNSACRMAGIPYAIYVREYISERPLHRKILKDANQIFTVSKDLLYHLERMIGSGKIQLAYDTIDARPLQQRITAHRSSGIRLIPFSSDFPVVGLIGRIARFKQQDLFLRAIPTVLKQVPMARFVIVGAATKAEREYETYIRQLAMDLGINDQVVFMGQRKDAVEITAELTVACLTSTREPLGRVILEAQLCGCPVVAADTGGPPEVITDGYNGLLFSSIAPDAPDQLAKQIIRLLKDDRLRRSLAEHAINQMERTFAGETHVKQLETCLENLLLSNRTAPEGILAR
jgi:glycosyltransferase involved in cell wall biosynthesis